MRRDGLLLDFGGVVSRSLFECRAEIEAHFALPSGSLAWHGPFDAAADALWCQVAAQEIGEDEYWRRQLVALEARLGRKLGTGEAIAAACGADPDALIRPEAVAFVRRAKQAGCRVAILSNELERVYGAAFVARIGILAEVDAVIDGSRTGLRKPAAAAFAHALAALGRGAAATVFLDDQPANVAAAAALGLAAVSFDICAPDASFAAAARLLAI